MALVGLGAGETNNKKKKKKGGLLYCKNSNENHLVAGLSGSVERLGGKMPREHSGTNYTVYALRFMSLTRQVFVVCAHRI